MADNSAIVPITVEFPAKPVYRVARKDKPLIGSRIRQRDSSTQSGNRFDLVDSSVIYCATQLRGSFAEVLSPFRKVPPARIVVDQNTDSSFMNHGGLPAAWRDGRSIFHIGCLEPLPFLDLEDPSSLAFLDGELGSIFLTLGVHMPLDIPLVRGSNRRLTRAISTWAANQTDDDGEYLYSGVRYMSRLGNWECWAIFEGTDIELLNTEAIDRTNPDLQAIAAIYQITVH